MKPFTLVFIYSDTRVSAFDVIYYEGEKLFFCQRNGTYFVFKIVF